MPLRDWDEANAVAEQTMSSDVEPFDANTIANAQDLLALCRIYCPTPEVVAKGYWSTLSISWPDFELEVFDDRIEVYRFGHQSAIDIWYEQHLPGQNFSVRFTDELPKLST